MISHQFVVALQRVHVCSDPPHFPFQYQGNGRLRPSPGSCYMGKGEHPMRFEPQIHRVARVDSRLPITGAPPWVSEEVLSPGHSKG